MQTQERRPTPDEIPAQKLDYPASQSDMVPKINHNASAWALPLTHLA